MAFFLYFLLFAAALFVLGAGLHDLLAWNRKMSDAIKVVDKRLREEIFPHLKVDGVARPKIEAILADLRRSL